mgnify:CR=1 FL=1
MIEAVADPFDHAYVYGAVPSIAVTVRRLHDINKSGGYWFVRFIPLIGPIWLLILLVEDSSAGNNKYGPNPKKKMNEDDINLIGKEYNSVKEAYKSALQQASNRDVIYVGGSTFVVAEII